MHWNGGRSTGLGPVGVLDHVNLFYNDPYVLDLVTRDDSRTHEYDANAARHCPLPASALMTQSRRTQFRPPPLALIKQPQG